MNKTLKHAYHVALIICGVAALLSGARSFYYFFVILLLLRLISWRIALHYKDNVFLRSSANSEVLSSGETIELSYRLTNASMLPLWHGMVSFLLPQEMSSSSMRQHAVFLGPQETIPFVEEVLCPLRGYYALGETVIQVSDPMGFHTFPISFKQSLPISVYPQVVELPTILFQPRAEGGSLKVQERAFDDRTHLMNLKEYVKGDDLKNVHWKLSAKKDELIIREFHKSVSERLTVFMDGFYGNWGGAFNALEEERMVSFCASYVKGTLKRGLDFSLYLNNLNSDHLRGDRAEAMQEVMAMLTAFRSDGNKQFEEYLTNQLEQGVVYEHIVFIVPRVTINLVEFLSSIHTTYDLFALRADADVMDFPHIKLIDKLMGGNPYEST